jgi:hypothetical protein
MKKKRTPAPPGPAWKAAEEYGIDMSLIEINLEKTPEERILAHDRVRQMADALRDAMRKRDGKVSP